MLDPRIAQRQIELEQKKKQQQKNLQFGQNQTNSTPKPAAVQKPSAAKSYNQPAAYTESKTYTAPTPSATASAKQTVNTTLGGYSSTVTNATKGTVANTLAKAEAMAESVYKPNSQIANNEYTTAAQRQQQNAARQNYINRMQQQKAAKEYGGYTNATYGNVDGVKSSYSPLAPQAKATSGVTTKTVQQNNDFNTLWNKYGAQLMGHDTKPKATGPNAEMGRTTTQPKKEKSIFEKVENQSVNYAKSGWKLFDWMDDFGSNKGPNNEISDTVRIKAKERADLTAGAQGKSLFENPILDYDDMINPPDNTYRHNDVYWKDKEANDNLVKIALNYFPGIKPAETEIIMHNPFQYIPHASNIYKLKNSNTSAANTRNKVFTEYVGGYDEYGLNMDGGVPNAFMHIYLAAKMTDLLGEENTREFLTAHETFTDKQYEKGFLYKQDDIGFDTDVFPQYQKYDNNKEYPLVKHHAEMDLHNNDIGIQIALTTPTDAAEIQQQLEMYLGENETLDDLRIMFDGYSDREILFMKKAVNAVYSGEAAVIWDYPGINMPE